MQSNSGSREPGQVQRIDRVRNDLAFRPATGTAFDPLALLIRALALPDIGERLLAQVADDVAMELAGRDIAIRKDASVAVEGPTLRIRFAATM